MTKTKKLPKGRVIYANYHAPFPVSYTDEPIYTANPPGGYSVPVAVIPCRAQKEARAWIRLANRVADSYPRSNKVLTKHDYYCLRYLGIPTP